MAIVINWRPHLSICDATEATVRKCSSKKVVLKISQYSQENSYVGDCNLIKKRLQYSCFPTNIAKFLRTAFLKGYLRWLLLILDI